MSDIAISAEGLGKRYRIGALARQTTMGERLTHAMKAPARWIVLKIAKKRPAAMSIFGRCATCPLKCARAKWWA